ncbi:uncharacterized protein LOC118200015 [Stegodyphus dumicola]|uniref:uncharacterized protein LOC118200015 n=1 Tax=Stegodyphus dumicola TaxID=202533 RepID=UPI0015AB613F|nr:uncharacterized protein LOC118200015 [Stegodyphus dumicola]
MWLFIFAPLLVVCSGEYQSDICEKKYDDVCYIVKPTLNEFSSSEEIMDTLCPLLKDYTQCVHNYERTCDVITDEFPGEYEDVKNLLNEACNKSTKLHHEILEAIPCLRNAIGIMQSLCPEDRKKLVALYAEHMEDDIEVQNREVDSENDRLKHHCLTQLEDIVCLAEYTMDNCGGHARDGVLELFYRSGAVQSICSQDAISEIFDVLSELDIEEPRMNSVFYTFHRFTQK